MKVTDIPIILLLCVISAYDYLRWRLWIPVTLFIVLLLAGLGYVLSSQTHEYAIAEFRDGDSVCRWLTFDGSRIGQITCDKK
jgi:hypothetical protein